MKALFDVEAERSRESGQEVGKEEKELTERTKIIIIIATHKPYWMPEDPVYFPLQVGKIGKPDLGFEGDDTGINISAKNPYYCELTGLYWAWKNLKADYIGLVHYRRHFSDGGHRGDKKMHVIHGEAFERMLTSYPVLLPQKRHYWIETNYSQYAHAHHAVDLDLTRRILEEKFQGYVKGFDRVMKRTSGHRFNMFVMRSDILGEYCSWLFEILFTLEQRIDISTYTANDQRVFGFVGERLLDVWLEQNEIRSKDIPYVFMEKQNWVKKGSDFMRRKLLR